MAFQIDADWLIGLIWTLTVERGRWNLIIWEQCFE